MSPVYTKGIIYGLLCLVGFGGLGFGIYQQRYAHLVAAGNQAVAEQRFDTRHYEDAARLWMAKQDMLLFNQGVLAYEARNLSLAAEHFRQASQRTESPQLRMRALYNLGLVMLSLDEIEGAVELFKESLRLDPMDQDTKFNLERLYHFVLRGEGEQGQASLKQAPGNGEIQNGESNTDGAGRSDSDSGI